MSSTGAGILEQLAQQLGEERRQVDAELAQIALEKDSEVESLERETAAMEELAAGFRELREKKRALEASTDEKLTKARTRHHKLLVELGLSVPEPGARTNTPAKESDARAGLVQLGADGDETKARKISSRRDNHAQFLREVSGDGKSAERRIEKEEQVIPSLPDGEVQVGIGDAHSDPPTGTAATGAGPEGTDENARENEAGLSFESVPFAPSKYCHICGRYCEKGSFLCVNFDTKRCKKRICGPCDNKHELRSKMGGMCAHCRVACPETARCKVYAKSNAARKHREAASRAVS